MKCSTKPVFLALLLAWSLLLGTLAHAQTVPGCGSLRNAYGPFDYRDPVARRDLLPIVDDNHFTPEVETLTRGKSSTILGDLNYTLRAFPNHHRALRSVARYAIEGGAFPADASVPSAECYFERAIAFQPDDATVRAIYGNYLVKRAERDDARTQYEEALRLAPDSAEISYVAGLFFLDEGDLDRAETLANVAYAKGYPLPGLRNKLTAAKLGAKP